MNLWIKHVKKYHKKHPNLTYSECLKNSKKSYNRQKGGNALLSNEVYKSQSERDKVKGYIPLEGDKRSQVYKKNNKIVVSLRGTDPTNIKDLANDALIAVGLNKYSNRYKKDKKLVQDNIKKYGKDNVSITGHSLAGNIAKSLSRDLGVKSKVYNPGAGPRQFVSGVRDRVSCKLNPKGKRCKTAKLTTTYRTKYDPISVLGAHGVNTKHVKQKGFDPHGLDNFKGLGKKTKKKKKK